MRYINTDADPDDQKRRSLEDFIQGLIDEKLDINDLCARLSGHFANQYDVLIAIEIIRAVLTARRFRPYTN